MIELIFTLPTTVGLFVMNFAIWGGLIYMGIDYIITQLKEREIL